MKWKIYTLIFAGVMILMGIFPLSRGTVPTAGELIPSKEYYDNTQKISTPHMDFELPREATHYWNPSGLDTYEIIVSNLSFKGYTDKIVRITWKDKRYSIDTIKINYTVINGILSKSDIVPYSAKRDSSTTFNNLNVELGTISGYGYEVISKCKPEKTINKIMDLNGKLIDEVSIAEICKDINVSYPIYSWETYKPIDLTKINPSASSLSFTAVDDINVSVCGTLSNANTTYILNQSISTTGSCLTVNGNNITINLNGFNITGDGDNSGDIGITNINKLNLTVKNGLIYNFSTGIYTLGNFANLTNLTIYTDINTGGFDPCAEWTNEEDCYIADPFCYWDMDYCYYSPEEGYYDIYGIYSKGNYSMISYNNISSSYSEDDLINSFTAINHQGNNTVIRNNYIMNNNVFGSKYGIYINALSRYNNISNNKIDSLDSGIYLYSSDTNIINNSLSNINSNGIAFNSITNNTYFLNNNISGCSNGIAINGINNTYMNNNVSRNSAAGISSNNVNRNTIMINNTISYNGQYGIIYAGNDSDIRNNNITNNLNDGIFFGGARNNITNNKIYSNTRSGIYTVWVAQGGNNNISFNDIYNCSNGGSFACINIQESDNNLIDSNKINKSSKYGIWIQSSGGGGNDNADNNLIMNTNMTNINNYSVYISNAVGSNNTNNTFLNVSYDTENVSSSSVLIRQWYYKAYVKNYNNDPIQNANVRAWNSSGIQQFSVLTDVLGYTAKLPVTDYVNNGTAKKYYSLYTINASDSLNEQASHNFNASKGNNLTDVFLLRNMTYALSITSSAGWNVLASTYSIITGICPLSLTCNLHLDGVAIGNPYNDSFSAGSYVFFFNTSGNDAYVPNQVTNTLNSLLSFDNIANGNCRYKSLGYYNLNLPWLREEECI